MNKDLLFALMAGLDKKDRARILAVLDEQARSERRAAQTGAFPRQFDVGSRFRSSRRSADGP